MRTWPGLMGVHIKTAMTLLVFGPHSHVLNKRGLADHILGVYQPVSSHSSTK